MATVDDRVSPQIIIDPGAAQLQPQPPIQGIVTAVDGGASTTTILWDHGERVTVPDGQFDVLTNAGADEQNRLEGKWVRRVVNDELPSAEFEGRVIAVYKRTLDGQPPDSGPDFCLIATDHETYYEDLASVFQVVESR